MFKFGLVFFIAIYSIIPHLNHAICCPKEKVLFQKTNKNLSCSHFGGVLATSNNGVSTPLKLKEHDYARKYGHCETFVCQNGKPPGEGIYCGRGPCNIFGCNCDNGCIPGNAVRYFQALHGRHVYNVR